MAKEFILRLAGSEPVTFQTFDDDKDRKRPSLIRVRHGTFDEHAHELIALNNDGAGVFVMVNAGDGKVHPNERSCRAAASVIKVRALFVDLDGAPLTPVLKAALRPHIVVESSRGRWHAYWRVKDCRLEQFTALQAALQIKFHGDTVKDLPRVMRLPGFIHRKDKPFRSRLLSALALKEMS